MKIQVNKKDMIWNSIGTFFNLFGNFILLPFYLYFLSDDSYGLWNIFLSVGGITTLFDFGFNVTFARNITYCWSGAKELYKEKVEYSSNQSINYLLMKKVVITCKRVYLVISLLALLVLTSFGTVYVLHISESLDRSSVLTAWFIYIVAVFLNLYFGYYDSFLRGVGAIAEENIIKTISRIIHIVVAVTLLYLNIGIIGASLGYLSYGLFFRIIAKRQFYKYKNIGEKLDAVTVKISKNEIKEMFHIIWYNAWRDGLVQVADYFCNQVTVIIASLYLSLSITGAYSLAVQLTQAIVTVAAIVHTAYQPTLQSAYVGRNSEKIKDILSFILLSYVSITIMGMIALVTIGVPLISILKPSAVLSIPTIVGVGSYQFILKGRNIYCSYLSSTNRIIYSKSFLISGVLTILISYINECYLSMGLFGIIIAQIISQLIYNTWKWPYFVHKETKLHFSEIIPRGIKEFKKAFSD